MNSPLKPRNRFFVSLDLLVGVGLAGCIVASLIGLAGRFNWIVDLTNHLKVQYLVCCVLASVWYGLRKRPMMFAVAVVGVAINSWFVVPLFLKPAAGTHAKTDASNRASLRIFAANVYIGNRRNRELLEQIVTEQPDVVVITEFSEEWDELLKSIESEYPHFEKNPTAGIFGIAVYSRFKFEVVETPHQTGMTPTIVAMFTIRDTPLTLIAMHPVPPRSPDYSERRNGQLSYIGDMVSRIDGHLVVCGDLNVTRWSPWFNELARDRLRDGVQGFGLQVTWPVRNGRANHWLTQIQIDHCLVSAGITVDDFRTGRPTGSDHLPIAVDISF